MIESSVYMYSASLNPAEMYYIYISSHSLACVFTRILVSLDEEKFLGVTGSNLLFTLFIISVV